MTDAAPAPHATFEPLEGKALKATHVPPTCSIVVFDGAVRSSKSVSSLWMWLRYIRRGPRGALIMVGRTETLAINNLVMPLLDMLGPKRVVLNRGTGTVTILGREVWLYGANDEQARTKIQGMTLAGAYVDEAANIPESFWNMLRSRLSVPSAMLFATCNPEGPKHWLKVKWLDKAEWWLDKHGELHHFEQFDDDGNPKHLPIWRVTFVLDDNHWLVRNNPKFVHDLKNSWPRNSMWHKRYIQSEWVSADGAIYAMFDEATMTVSLAELPRMQRVLIAALDYGTDHPTRAYLLGMVEVAHENGRPLWGKGRGLGLPTMHVLVVLDEFAPEQATVGEHATQFERWLERARTAYGQPDWIAIDPAAATFKMEMFARGHADVMNAHNAVIPGIQTVQSLMASRRLYVVKENCPKLLEHIPAYEWSTKATEAGRTEPVKDNDDEVDALRYCVYTSRHTWRALIPLAPIANDDDAAA